MSKKMSKAQNISKRKTPQAPPVANKANKEGGRINKKTLGVSIVVLVVIALAVSFIYASNKRNNNNNEKDGSEMTEFNAAKEKVVIEMMDGGIIKLELYPEEAPITVENFVGLVKSGFYDGLIFHRVIPGFMIQGGDPQGSGMGGSGKNIKGEFSSNGVDNKIKHVKGVISMARSQANDSASSQFFIMHDNATHLDGSYAAFGKVVEGLDVVDKIAAVQTNSSNLPNTPQKIKTITIE